jgi:hypothetical protein
MPQGLFVARSESKFRRTPIPEPEKLLVQKRKSEQSPHFWRVLRCSRAYDRVILDVRSLKKYPNEREVGVPPIDRRLGARISVGRFGQLDLYPPSGWRVVQDITASASSIPSQRTVLRRLFREAIPDCTLQCGPTKRGLSIWLAKRPSLCVSGIRLYSPAANMRQGRSASNASGYRD